MAEGPTETGVPLVKSDIRSSEQHACSVENITSKVQKSKTKSVKSIVPPLALREAQKMQTSEMYDSQEILTVRTPSS